MNNQQKQQVKEQLSKANNVLVAVSSNPTVDELSASIALTLLLNKLDKHATTVFSGVVPSTLEFLQPEKTIETTTDSLRDFIIALDKSKADKLRYKVEDDVVRIFITPYRASITDHDLQFSQGDFNVDVVIALGVTRREDLDRAITAHGRILHDAAVVSLTNRGKTSELGTLNWQEAQASSLCEMVAALAYDLSGQSIDGQMATALLTGIIAETDRFRNDKTTPFALSLSSQLMTAGANQQLIAEKLEEPVEIQPQSVSSTQPQPESTSPPPKESNDGALEIEHDGDQDDENSDVEKIHIDEHGNLMSHDEEVSLPPVALSSSSQPYIEEPIHEPYMPSEEHDDQNRVEEDRNESNEKIDEPAQHVSTADGLQDESPKYADDGQQDQKENPTQELDQHATPMMSHERVIQPPKHENDMLKSDKPFDLQEALQAKIATQEGAFTPTSAPSINPAVITPTQQFETTAQLPEPVSAPVSVPMPPPPTEKKEENSHLQAPPQVITPHAITAPTGDSLADLERSVESPHLQQVQNVDSMRDAVAKAADAQSSSFPWPTQSVGSSPMEAPESAPQTQAEVIDPNAAPPVPPPIAMTPQFYDADGKSHSPLNN